ncbi:hypothetical protein AB4563_04905 [Vibrio splendidus]
MGLTKSKKYDLQGDKASHAKAGEILDGVSYFLLNEETIKAATAGKVIREQISKSSSAEEVNEIYQEIFNCGTINSFSNGVKSSVLLENYGAKILINTERSSSVKNGELHDSVLTSIEFGEGCGDVFDGNTVLAEMVDTPEGKFEQLKFYGSDGKLFASKTYSLDGMALSVAEAGWGKYALADVTLNATLGSRYDYFSGNWVGESAAEVFHGQVLESPNFDKVVDFGYAGRFNSSELMNPAAIGLFERIIPTTLAQTPFISKPSLLDILPQNGVSADLYKYTSGNVDINFGGSGSNVGAQGTYNPMTNTLKATIKVNGSKELCSFNIPQTPFPDRICFNVSAQTNVNIIAELSPDNVELHKLDGDIGGSLHTYYEAGSDAFGATAKAGLMVAVNPLDNSSGVKYTVTGEASVKVGGVEAVISTELLDREIDVAKNKAEEKVSDRENDDDSSDDSSDDDSDDDSENSPSDDHEEEITDNEKSDEEGCEINPNISGGSRTGPPPPIIPEGLIQAVTQKDPDKCGTEGSDTEEVTNDFEINPQSILQEIVQQNWGCGDDEILKYFFEEMNRRLNALVSDPLFSGNGWCGTSRLVEAVSNFDGLDDINLEEYGALNEVITAGTVSGISVHTSISNEPIYPGAIPPVNIDFTRVTQLGGSVPLTGGIQ